MLLLIDNFDSFTYNIVQGFERLGKRVQVIRPSSHFDFHPDIDRVVIGPGPGHPQDAHYSLKVIEHFLGKIPLLGICLGHQCLAHFFGGTICPASKPLHGKASVITHDGLKLYHQIPSPHSVIRYHSLIVNPLFVPSCLQITAKTQEGEIMGLRHIDLPVESVQYHPDSILTEHGSQFFSNFLNY